MNEELKTIVAEQIIDNQQADFVPASPRTLEIRALDGVISIVMGVRRCGKSTLMESIMARLVTKGVPRENIVWLNFSDDRFLPLRLGDWDTIHSVYFSIYPEKRRKEKVYFFFDEIQLYPNWELFVERLRREENCEIYITGSSARMLSKEIGTASGAGPSVGNCFLSPSANTSSAATRRATRRAAVIASSCRMRGSDIRRKVASLPSSESMRPCVGNCTGNISMLSSSEMSLSDTTCATHRCFAT